MKLGFVLFALFAVASSSVSASPASVGNQVSVLDAVAPWVKVTYAIPVYVDGVFVGYYIYEAWEWVPGNQQQ